MRTRKLNVKIDTVLDIVKWLRDERLKRFSNENIKRDVIVNKVIGSYGSLTHVDFTLVGSPPKSYARLLVDGEENGKYHCLLMHSTVPYKWEYAHENVHVDKETLDALNVATMFARTFEFETKSGEKVQFAGIANGAKPRTVFEKHGYVVQSVDRIELIDEL